VKEMPLRMPQTRTQSGERESKIGLFHSDQSTRTIVLRNRVLAAGAAPFHPPRVVLPYWYRDHQQRR
jgi:hypothetical protein